MFGAWKTELLYYNEAVWKLALFGSVLLLWLICLCFILFCAHDLIGFPPGRERWFALTLNSVFLISSLLFAFRLGKSFRRFPKSTWAIFIGFLSILIATGLWIPIVASVSGPPWQSKIVQIPYSADTPFMDSVWAWEEGDPGQK